MSGTPRTDEAERHLSASTMVDLCRQLERELAQERKENDESAKLLQEALAEIRRLNRFFITSGHD
jgi:hypothetical protein